MMAQNHSGESPWKGPLFKLGRVHWTEHVSVPIESWIEAKELMQAAREERARIARIAESGAAQSEHVANSSRDRRTSKRQMASATQLANQIQSESPLAERNFTVPEVAAYFRRHESTIRKYCQMGDLVKQGCPIEGAYIIAMRIGSEWLISESELLKFKGRLEGREVASRARASPRGRGGAQK